MNNSMKIIAGILLFAAVLSGCSKKEDLLKLDENYLTVADLLQYCQGSCDETLDWENKTALVTGHVRDIESDSVKDQYYADSMLFLMDIRNGMFMEIRVTDNKDPIFEKIWNAEKRDVFYIKGTAKPIIAIDVDECSKGVVLLLDHPDNINYESL